MAGTHPSFEFKHLLTKLIVKVKAHDEAAQNVWGDITGITLVKAMNGDVFDTAEVTLATGAAATGTAAFSNPAVDGMAFYRIDAAAYTDNAVDDADNKIALTTTAEEVAYSLVAPIIADNDAKHITLKVDTKLGETVTTKEVSFDLYKVNDTDEALPFTGDTQGKAFEITLTFKATEIVATATVTDWVKGGNTEVEIQ